MLLMLSSDVCPSFRLKNVAFLTPYGRQSPTLGLIRWVTRKSGLFSLLHKWEESCFVLPSMHENVSVIEFAAYFKHYSCVIRLDGVCRAQLMQVISCPNH